MSTTVPTSFTLEELLSHRAWAQRLARRLVGAADAEDLVQDGVVAGLLARPADRDGLAGWLATVLGRAAAHRRRGEQRRVAREQVAGTLAAGQAIPTPESLMAELELQRLLAELVLALAPGVRDVILLRFYESLSSPEIARTLGVPEATVRWRIKQGLEELRQGLDRRHGGREVWVGLFGPFGVGEARRRSHPRRADVRRSTPAPAVLVAVGLPLLTLVAVVAGFLLGPLSRARIPGVAAGVSVATPSSGAAPYAGPPAARRPPRLAALVSDDGCFDRLSELHRQIAAAEPEFVETARVNAPRALFSEGARNPAAEGVLLPIVRRALATLDPALRPTLRCHTHVCELAVAVPVSATRLDWEQPLRRDSELRERTRSSSARVQGPEFSDLATGASYREEQILLSLWTPAAEAFSRAKLMALGGPPPVPPPTFAPPPNNLDGCRVQLRAAEDRLASMNAIIERYMLPQHRFERSPLNPALTSEMEVMARQILALPADSRAVSLECRRDVCRIDFDRQTFPGPNDWKALFTPAWRKRVQGPNTVGGWRAYVTVAPVTSP